MAEKITVYHGSKGGLQGAIRPDVGDGACDFGAGFYMGTNVHQPQTLICNRQEPILYTLGLDLEGLNVFRFKADAEWALFVAFNRGQLEQCRDSVAYRRFESIRAENDVIFGKIANDKLFTTLALFFDNLIGDTTLVQSLSVLNIGEQYCAVTKKACEQISIIGEHKFSSAELDRIRQKSETQKAWAQTETERIRKATRHQGRFFDELVEGWMKEKCT